MSKGGRPTDYSAEIIEKTKLYLKSCTDKTKLIKKGKTFAVGYEVKLPSIEGLALYLGAHRDTLYEWEKSHPEFSDILERVRQEQAIRLMNKGLSGDYHPLITKMILAKHGYADKSEIDHTSKGERINGFNYAVPNDSNHNANAKTAPGVATTEG